MRDVLALLEGQRLTVTAAMERTGLRPAFVDMYEPTILLRDVRTLDGALLTDHLWMGLGRRFAAVAPRPGDLLQFTAWVRRYGKQKLVTRSKGEYAYLRRIDDYTLRLPSGVSIVLRAAARPVPVPVAPAPPAPPSPAPMSELPDVGAPPTTAQRMLHVVVVLTRELGEPPSLTRVLAHASAAPTTTIAALRKLAKRGLLAFTPDGRVEVRPVHTRLGRDSAIAGPYDGIQRMGDVPHTMQNHPHTVIDQDRFSAVWPVETVQ